MAGLSREARPQDSCLDRDRRRLRRIRPRVQGTVRPLPARTALYARPRTEVARQAQRGLTRIAIENLKRQTEWAHS